MIAAPEAPERGDQYGLEVWQRIRHKLPERPEPWWAAFFRRDRLALAAAAAMLVLVAFVAGRVWPRQPAAPAATAGLTADGATAGAGNASRPETPGSAILLTSVADHLDRSERVLTDIMNAPDTQRHLERAALGGRPADHEPALSAGRGRRRRAIGGGRARRRSSAACSKSSTAPRRSARPISSRFGGGSTRRRCSSKCG